MKRWLRSKCLADISVPLSQHLRPLLQQVAAAHPETKFLAIQAQMCIPNYPDRNVPTLLVYRNGDMVGNVVAGMGLKGMKTTAKGEWKSQWAGVPEKIRAVAVSSTACRAPVASGCFPAIVVRRLTMWIGVAQLNSVRKSADSQTSRTSSSTTVRSRSRLPPCAGATTAMTTRTWTLTAAMSAL